MNRKFLLSAAIWAMSSATYATAATVTLTDLAESGNIGFVSYSGIDSDIQGYFNGALNNTKAELFASGNNGYESGLVEGIAGLPTGSLNLGGTEISGSNPGNVWTVAGSSYFTIKFAKSIFVLFNSTASNVEVTFAADPDCKDIFASNQCSSKVSHSKFVTVEGPSAVPLPAAGWLLIAGLGGLGALRRFRKS